MAAALPLTTSRISSPSSRDPFLASSTGRATIPNFGRGKVKLQHPDNKLTVGAMYFSTMDELVSALKSFGYQAPPLGTAPDYLDWASFYDQIAARPDLRSERIYTSSGGASVFR